MRSAILVYYPKLNSVLSSEYRTLISTYLQSPIHSSSDLNSYASFIDIINTDSEPVTNYAALNILNSSAALNEHYRIFIGFIYTEMEVGLHTKHRTCYRFKIAFSSIAVLYKLSFNSISHSPRKITDDVECCMSFYKKSKINHNKLAYYQGWRAQDKTGYEHNFHLANVYDNYGKSFTNKLSSTLSDFVKRHKKTTAVSTVGLLVHLWNDIIELHPAESQMRLAMSTENMCSTFLKVLNSKIARITINKDSVSSYLNNTWCCVVYNFTGNFIDKPGWFDQPQPPIITPKFNTLKKRAKVSTGGALSNQSKERLFIGIPLAIPDDAAIKILTKRIGRDIEHVRTITDALINEIISRHERNQNLIKQGYVKPIPNKNKRGKGLPIGKNNLANTLATFYKYHFFFPGTNYGQFLGFGSFNNELIRELNLPTQVTLMPFLIQLTLEHPRITPSWFKEWELYDRNSNMVGFQKTGNQHVAVSFKNRKGASEAQQIVILNERSKKVVEALITFTSLVREDLKNKGDEDWRYMLITASSVSKKPIRLKTFKNTAFPTMSSFNQALSKESHDNGGNIILTAKEAQTLANGVTIRSTRSSRAVHIYLETLSTRAMSEALGHKSYDSRLLSSYLPDVILEFFNNRWIRIFQNSIIYEAMKDSPYLFNSVDFSECDLDEFLKNHKLAELSSHLENGKKIAQSIEAKPKEIVQFDELRLALSVPLLQVLIAISDVVENAKNDEVIPCTLGQWYESAAFIIQHLTLSQEDKGKTKGKTWSTEVISLLEKAKMNPLDRVKFKEQLCHLN